MAATCNQQSAPNVSDSNCGHFVERWNQLIISSAQLVCKWLMDQMDVSFIWPEANLFNSMEAVVWLWGKNRAEVTFLDWNHQVPINNWILKKKKKKRKCKVRGTSGSQRRRGFKRTRLNGDGLYACVHVWSVLNGVGFFCGRCETLLCEPDSNNSSPRNQALSRRWKLDTYTHTHIQKKMHLTPRQQPHMDVATWTPQSTITVLVILLKSTRQIRADAGRHNNVCYDAINLNDGGINDRF